MLESENQSLIELAELVADYDRKQWKWLEPVLHCRAEPDAETLATLESEGNPYDLPEA